MMDKALAKKYQNGLKLEIIIKGQDDKELEQSSDLAPEVKDANEEGMEENPEMMAGQEADPEMAMLKKMTEGSVPPNGREPMSLGERAQEKMRMRMEEKQKGKSKKNY